MKNYSRITLEKKTKAELIDHIFKWQDTPQVQSKEVNMDELMTGIYNRVDAYVGRRVGRKINGVHPGPPEPLEKVMEDIATMINEKIN